MLSLIILLFMLFWVLHSITGASSILPGGILLWQVAKACERTSALYAIAGLLFCYQAALGFLGFCRLRL